MANEPDSEATSWRSIEVIDTPERDNPKFGAVTIHLDQDERRSQSLRMTRIDAEVLVDKLSEYLYEYEMGL